MTTDAAAPATGTVPAAGLPAAPDAGLRSLYPNSPDMFPEQTPSTPAAEPAITSAAQEQPAQAAPIDVSAYADMAMPEGFEVAPELLSKATQVFAKAGLSKAQAEQMVAVHAELGAERDRTVRAGLAEVERGWRDEVMRTVPAADLNAARRAAALAPPEVRQLLDVTGLGNHPGLIRWIAGLGRQLGGHSAPPADRYTAMYPTMRERR